MNCKSCGAELKENVKFCPQCGAKIEPDVCPKCNTPLKSGANFCPQCGTKINVQANNISPVKNVPSTQEQNKKVEVRPEDIVNSEELVAKGCKLYEKSKFDDAIKVFNESIGLNPGNYLAFFWRGCAYESVEEYDRAISDFSEAIKLEPSDKDSYFCRGRTFLGKEEYENAIPDFSEFISSNHTNADAYNFRGVAYYYSGDYSSAIKDYKRAISLEPKNKTFQENLQNAEEILQNADNGDTEEDIEDGEENINEEVVESGLIKCNNCNTKITIDTDSFEMDATYVCPNCNEEIEVSFWGFCEKCNSFVGFHHSIGKTLFGIGKALLEGYLADEEGTSIIKKEFLGRMFSKVVDAKEWGECPFCGREYLMCPECEKSVRWPLNSDNNKVVECDSCGTKMKHP